MSGEGEAADPALSTPLAPFAGARPPAPAWFDAALAEGPERSFVEVEGCAVELLAWGERGRPGLLLLHGAGAHADWWSPLAPFFADGRRVAAISWSGMGRSGWRERYAYPLFVAEALAGAQAAGLFEAGPPLVAAHSFGGGVATALAAAAGERLRAVVMLDAAVRPPAQRWRFMPGGEAPTRVYPTLEAALARFRLRPAQPCAHAWYLDHIARHGLREVEGGWTWRFDPFMWSRLDRSDRLEQEVELSAARCPLAFVWGDRSVVVTPEAVAYTRAHAAPGTPMFAVPDAAHHLMLDQPLASVAALRALFAGWPR